ncbi:MAG: arginine deiminase family protein [Bacteroidota bacterium]
MKVKVHSETGTLQRVILGIASDRGTVKHLNNPKYAEAVARGVDPTEAELVAEVEGLYRVLVEQGVEVLRPPNIPQQDQIFCRDIGFAIGEDFFLARMKKANRKVEQTALHALLRDLERVHHPPPGATIEGGDIVLHGEYVFVGLGDRTNQLGLRFLQRVLGQRKTVIPLPLRVTNEARTNTLHLDCAFQPVGTHSALLYPEGFSEFPQAIYDRFGAEQLIEVNAAEMYDMVPNILSLSPNKVLIERSFVRLASELEKRNIQAIPVDYARVAQLGGLLRCSTCPLNREE